MTNAAFSTLRRIRTAHLFGRARRASSRQNFDLAIILLSKIFVLSGSEGPQRTTPLLANVLYADCCLKTGRKEDSYNVCVVILDQCDYLEHNKVRIFNRETIKYIRYIVKWILSLLSPFVDSEAFKLALSIENDFNDLDIAFVSKLTLKTFPISEDEGRRLDRFIAENR